MKFVVRINVLAGKEDIVLNQVEKLWKREHFSVKTICLLDELYDIFLTADEEKVPFSVMHKIRKIQGVAGTEIMVLEEAFAEKGKAKGEAALIFFDLEIGKEKSVIEALKKLCLEKEEILAFSGGYIFGMHRDLYLIAVVEDMHKFVKSVRQSIPGIVDTEWYHLRDFRNV